MYIREKQILLSDELIRGRQITKFPGGGVQPGEGPAEALVREWQEELRTPVTILRQFYFTDFLVPSFMDDGSQIISLYFEVTPTRPLGVPLATKPFDLPPHTDKAESFRFISIEALPPQMLTFPIDQHVAQLLKKGH